MEWGMKRGVGGGWGGDWMDEGGEGRKRGAEVGGMGGEGINGVDVVVELGENSRVGVGSGVVEGKWGRVIGMDGGVEDEG